MERKESLEEKRRLPKTAVICIKGSEDTFSYTDALKRIRTEISLKDLDIQIPKIRKGLSGSTIMEISGENNIQKADQLANEMQRVLDGEAHITRPIIRREVKLLGMDKSDAWINADEIRCAVAAEGCCKTEEVHVDKIGRTWTGMGIAWVQCPRTATVKIVELGRISIERSSVRVELLKSRPVQCKRGWRVSRVREKCKSTKDYSNCCFKCGIAGHAAIICTNKIRCTLCSDLGLNENHRMRSDRCRGIEVLPRTDKGIASHGPKQRLETNLAVSDPAKGDGNKTAKVIIAKVAISVETDDNPNDQDMNDASVRRTDDTMMEIV